MCNKQGESGGGASPIPPARRALAAQLAGWKSDYNAALVIGRAGKPAEARASGERLLAAIEGVLGPEAEELLMPLDVIGQATRRAGHLADSYTVMLRTLTVSEKHHGEEGLFTCQLRTQIGMSRIIEHPPIPPPFAYDKDIR